jgi:hypothetical protein
MVKAKALLELLLALELGHSSASKQLSAFVVLVRLELID